MPPICYCLFLCTILSLGNRLPMLTALPPSLMVHRYLYSILVDALFWVIHLLPKPTAINMPELHDRLSLESSKLIRHLCKEISTTLHSCLAATRPMLAILKSELKEHATDMLSKSGVSSFIGRHLGTERKVYTRYSTDSRVETYGSEMTSIHFILYACVETSGESQHCALTGSMDYQTLEGRWEAAGGLWYELEDGVFGNDSDDDDDERASDTSSGSKETNPIQSDDLSEANIHSTVTMGGEQAILPTLSPSDIYWRGTGGLPSLEARTKQAIAAAATLSNRFYEDGANLVREADLRRAVTMRNLKRAIGATSFAPASSPSHRSSRHTGISKRGSARMKHSSQVGHGSFSLDTRASRRWWI